MSLNETSARRVVLAQAIETTDSQGKLVSEVCNRFEPLPQILENVRYKDGQPLDNLGVQRAINDGKSRLGTAGRLVIRPSGTEPVIRVMAEGDDPDLVASVVNDIVGVISDNRTAA